MTFTRRNPDREGAGDEMGEKMTPEEQTTVLSELDGPTASPDISPGSPWDLAAIMAAPPCATDTQDGDDDAVWSEWCPTTLADAEWLIGRILSAREEVARIQAQAERLVNRCTYIESQVMRRYGQPLEFLLACELAARNDGKKKPVKTLHLLTGSVKWRACGGGLKIDDEPAALEWAAGSCHDAIKTVVTAIGAEGFILAAEADTLEARGPA